MKQEKETGNYYGYVRVSSVEQHIDRQIVPLLELGIPQKQIYIDKVSGKDFNRKEYQKLRKKLKTGDILFFKSIDRLGRNYDEIINEWQYLTKDKCIDICILDMPLLDTRKNKDLLGTLISDLVLYVLSYVAQQEREYIKMRQAEGIIAARSRGVVFGRPSEEIPNEFINVYKLYITKEIRFTEALMLLDINKSRFFYLKNKYEAMNI